MDTQQQLTEYKTVTAWTTYDLEVRVRDMIALGFEPLGGAAVSVNDYRYEYLQTLVKKHPKRESES